MTTEVFSAGQTREFYGEGDFFRLLATSAEVTIEFFYQGREVAEAEQVEAGFAEYFREKQFDRIRIYSATAQTVKWVIRQGSDVRYDRGAASITGEVSLDAATLAALEHVSVRQEAATAAFMSAGALSANVAQQIFSPGANANGAVVLSAYLNDVGSSPFVLIAKAGAAPTSVTDGEVIALSTYTSSGNYQSIKMEREQEIEPGRGLYFIGTSSSSAPYARACRYKLR